MRILGMVVAVALAVAAVLAAPVGAKPKKSTGTKLKATMEGAKERPDPGPSGASGKATIRLNQGAGTVCYSLTWSGIGDPVMAHIHRGGPEVAGTIVVPLFTQPPARHHGCVHASRSLIKKIRRSPDDYYVNIHTQEFPAGVMRGQLEK
jgi:hypothetical protein